MRQRRARDLAVMNRPIRVGSSGQDTPTELSHPIAMRNRALADAGGQYATTQQLQGFTLYAAARSFPARGRRGDL